MGAPFARVVAPEVDRVFIRGMDTSRDQGGRDLVDRHGPGAGGVLVEFRTALAWPGRGVSPEGFAAVLRYRDLASGREAVSEKAELGWLDVDTDGTFRATERGLAFLTALYDHHARVLADLWPPEVAAEAAELAGRVLDAAMREPGPALAAMGPPFEPAGATPGLLLLNRLGTLRYHRSDAHAAAWQAAGHTAASIRTMPPGPEREAIEDGTNERAAPPYAVLSEDERRTLLAHLALLSASGSAGPPVGARTRDN